MQKARNRLCSSCQNASRRKYLSQILADVDTNELLRTIGYVAKARGMAKPVRKETNIWRRG
jgi:DNA-binding phage protein